MLPVWCRVTEKQLKAAWPSAALGCTEEELSPGLACCQFATCLTACAWQGSEQSCWCQLWNHVVPHQDENGRAVQKKVPAVLPGAGLVARAVSSDF